MNKKLKQRALDRLREDRFTRDICPGVRSEDWVLVFIYRHPFRLKHCIPQIRSTYMRTPTGRALCRKLHEFIKGEFLSLGELDRDCRIQCSEYPRNARKWNALRQHIARLRRIPRMRTPGDYRTEHTICAWCEYRRKLLLPHRAWPTQLLESKLMGVKEKVILTRHKLELLAQRRERLCKAEQGYFRCLRDLIHELKRRPDRLTNLAEIRRLLMPFPHGGSLRERLFYRITAPPEEDELVDAFDSGIPEEI